MLAVMFNSRAPVLIEKTIELAAKLTAIASLIATKPFAPVNEIVLGVGIVVLVVVLYSRRFEPFVIYTGNSTVTVIQRQLLKSQRLTNYPLMRTPLN
jgi:hypothetical protein